MPERVQRQTGFLRPLIPLLLIYSSGGMSLPTATIDITAGIVNGCILSGTAAGTLPLGALNFGSRPGIGTSTATASFVQGATIALACTPNTVLNMSIDGGLNFAGNSRNMKIASNTDVVPYTLYTSAAQTTTIPVGQNIPLTFSNPNVITLPIFGALQLSGVRRAGNYSDTLTVTLTW